MACTCIKDLNEKLAEHNAVLVTTILGMPSVAVIGTVKLDSKKRGKPPVMLASFCPFCGAAYEDASADVVARQVAAPELLEALTEVREACLYPEDDGQIGITSEPTIDSAMFGRICAAIAKATNSDPATAAVFGQREMA